MTSDRREELLSGALDGDLSASEREELDALLDSEEGRQIANEYTELHSLLGKLAAETPPDSLRELIADQVQLPAGRSSKKHGWQWLFPGIRYAVAVATGALAAVVVLNVDPGTGSVPTGSLTGSMAPAAAQAETASIDRREFGGEGFEGRASLEARDTGLVLELEYAAATPVDISVRFGGSGLRVESLAALGEPLDSVSLSDDALTLRAEGRRRVQVELRRAGTANNQTNAITLEIASNGELLDSGMLEFDR